MYNKIDNFKNRGPIKGKVIEVFGQIHPFADKMGITYTHALNLLTGKTRWTLDMARRAAEVLGFKEDAREITRIFFCE